MDESKGYRKVVFQDMIIFQVKLAIDAAKDLIFAPLALGATLLDLIAPGERPGHRFYSVMRLGERFDGWVSLFSAARKEDALDERLTSEQKGGADSLLDRMAGIVATEEGSAPRNQHP